MNRGRPIYWHEGVFLRPQHFQQQDEFHDAKSYAFATASRPWFWGVGELRIAGAALKNQVFELEACEIVFPDGTWLQFPGNAVVPARSFEGLWDESGKPLSVWLGLKKLAPEGINVYLPGDVGAAGRAKPERAETRFVVSDGDTATKDLYAREGREPILYLEYSLRLFFGAEAAAATDHYVIKLAEVQRQGGDIQRVENYVPALLHLGASAVLTRWLRDLNEQLKSRGHELAQFKHGKGIDAPDLGSRDLLYLLGLLTLNRWIPLMQHYLTEPRVTPWTCYGMLRQIVGELSTFSGRYDVFGGASSGDAEDGLPEYDHAALGECFAQAVRRISGLLEELTAGPDLVVPLLFDGTYYYADVVPRAFQGNNRYYLCVRSGRPATETSQLLQNLAKFSSREYLPLLIARSLPGTPVESLAALPAELPRRAASVYFGVDPHGPAWDAIRDGNNAAVYLEQAPDDIEIELMVVYGK